MGGDEGCKAATRFTRTFEKEHGNRIESSCTREFQFGLNEESQRLGWKLYVIPIIKRIVYAVSPWWKDDFGEDSASNQPITYRFISTAQQIHKVPVDLSDPMFGMNTDNLNTEDMAEWRIDTPGRKRLEDNRDAAQILFLEWISPNAGDSVSLKMTHEKTLTTTHENEFEMSETIAFPEVFSLSDGFIDSWSGSTEMTTSLSNGVEASYGQVTEKEYGPLISGLSVSVYWFY